MEEQRQAIEALLSETRRCSRRRRSSANARASRTSPTPRPMPIPCLLARARAAITWFNEPTEVLDDSNPPFYKWFADGELNVSYNCLDRHIAAGGGDKTALIWIGEPGEERHISYLELRDEVAHRQRAEGAWAWSSGDRVAIYIGMVPELPIAMLACTRIGAAHSVVFGGFSATSLADRIDDAACKVLITCDGAWRRGRSSRSRRPPTRRSRTARRSSTCWSCAAPRTRWLGRGPRRLVARRRGRGRRLVRARAMGAEDVLYLLYTSRHDRQAQGHRATRPPATCSAR